MADGLMKQTACYVWISPRGTSKTKTSPNQTLVQTDDNTQIHQSIVGLTTFSTLIVEYHFSLDGLLPGRIDERILRRDSYSDLNRTGEPAC